MKTLRDVLDEGPYTLALSAGYFGFFAHAGLVTALLDDDRRPARVTGASAGALVGAAVAAGVDPTTLRDRLYGLQRAHFWDPGIGLGLLRGDLFLSLLRDVLGDRDFTALATPCALSVHDVLAFKTRAIETGDVAWAVRASCALPGLFHPAWRDGRPYIDGGVQDRPGLFGARESPRVVQHQLVSRSARRRGMPAPREGLVTLVVPDLPRVSPFALEQGRRAFDFAAKAWRAALDRPIVDGVVSI